MDKIDSVCRVCGDKASGKHYGVPSCDGCRGFFKRSIRRGLAYHCKEAGCCIVDVARRNQCQACRFKKCLAVNMKRDAVQHERAPRTSSQGPQCARRPPYPFAAASASGVLGPPSSAYHLLYPQHSFPFPMGLKPLQFGFFNYSVPFSTSASTNRSDPCSFLGLPSTSSIVDVKIPLDSSRGNSNSEDEVTSSEEIGQSTENFTPEALVRKLNIERINRNLPSQCLAFKLMLMVHFREFYTRSTSSKAKHYEDKSLPRSRLGPSLLSLPLTQGPEGIFESAAKLLFLTVRWARSIPSFLQLSFQDQTLLLEESWSDLFVLSAGEWVLPIDKDCLVSQSICTIGKRQDIQKEVQRLEETILKLVNMKLDHTEYACLKALILFKPDAQGLTQRNQVEQLQEQAHALLQEHCCLPETPRTRFGKLLLLLPTVHALSKQLLEELLFRKTIGNICIERVLADMLRSTFGE